MASTLVDVSIFEHLMKLKKSDLKSRKKILDAFVKGLEIGRASCRERV
jgi:hypothetical protein